MGEDIFDSGSFGRVPLQTPSDEIFRVLGQVYGGSCQVFVIFPLHIKKNTLQKVVGDSMPSAQDDLVVLADKIIVADILGE